MQEWIEHLGRCLAKASSAKTDDLAALVDLHVDLMAMHEMAAEKKGGNPGVHPEVLSGVDRIAQTVEKLVLNESDGAEISIEAVNRQISELQNLISGVTTQPAKKLANAATSAALGPATESLQPKPAAPVNREEKVISELDAPLAIEFVGEARNHLDTAEASLLNLEEDNSDLSEHNAVFRAFHTIKGVAGFLGMKQIGALAHSAETVLDLARKGKLQCSGMSYPSCNVRSYPS